MERNIALLCVELLQITQKAATRWKYGLRMRPRETWWEKWDSAVTSGPSRAFRPGAARPLWRLVVPRGAGVRCSLSERLLLVWNTTAVGSCRWSRACRSHRRQPHRTRALLGGDAKGPVCACLWFCVSCTENIFTYVDRKVNTAVNKEGACTILVWAGPQSVLLLRRKHPQICVCARHL